MKEIIIDYTENKLSIENIATKYKIGKLKVKNILHDNNISINKKGNQKKIFEVQTSIDIENKLLECKICNKRFNDIENKSGAITQHISQCYKDVSIPNQYHRSIYKKTNGEYWHFQFFNIIEKNDIEKLKCPMCEWESTDIKNKTGAFTKHINENHIGVEYFISKYPEYINFFNSFKIQIDKKESIENNHVVCKICGEKLKIINNTHLSNHNISVEEYKLKYPLEKLVSDDVSKKLSETTKILNKTMTKSWSSSAEIELMEIIKNFGFDVNKSKNRGLLEGKEIDIVIEDLKLCIEYNGLYYHTEKMGKGRNYHLDKTKACNNIGYKLIHIFEDEWINKKDIVVDKIKHLLLLNNQTKIGARKTIIKRIDNNTKNNFLNHYHIQGSDKSTINYGAYYQDELVGVMTFNGNRNMTKNNNGEYELTRFATKLGYSISGLGSKLLKTFINDVQPKSIISFADIRWTPNVNDNLYTKMGFKLIKLIEPNYTYYNSKINKYKRFHKFNFGKNNIKKKYPNVDLNKSEFEIMSELGYDKIWDCGLIKYQYII